MRKYEKSSHLDYNKQRVCFGESVLSNLVACSVNKLFCQDLFGN